MSVYTKEVLEKLNKKELITILLSLQSKVVSANNKILDQVRQLNQEFSQLESENSVVKQANSLLWKRLVDMERSAGQTPSILEESVLKWWLFLTGLIITNWKTKC